MGFGEEVVAVVEEADDDNDRIGLLLADDGCRVSS
jgi:hypothetical protein